MAEFQQVETGENIIVENGNNTDQGIEWISCRVPLVNSGHVRSIGCIGTGKWRGDKAQNTACESYANET